MSADACRCRAERESRVLQVVRDPLYSLISRSVHDTFLGSAVFWVSTPPVRSDDLRGKQFSTHRPGYDKTQVAAFLEAAGLRLAAMEATDRPAGPLVSDALLVAWAEWAEQRIPINVPGQPIGQLIHQRGVDPVQLIG